MVAIAQALRFGQQDISLYLTLWTPIAFLVGFSSAFAYLRFVFTYGDRTPRLFRRSALGVLVSMAARALFYPFRSVPVHKLPERFVAVGVVLGFIAVGLVLIWRMMLAAEREEEKQDAMNPNHHS